MPKARVLKGGWSWKGVAMQVGDVIDAPSAEWIRNRMADGGLVEVLAEDVPEVAPAEIETAVVSPPEVSAFLRKSKRSK